MAITVIYTTGATGGGTGSNYTLTPPNSSAQAGDVAVIVVGERMSTESVTGITDTATGTKAFTKLRFSAPSSVAATGIWYRVLQSGDPGVGNTNTWTVATTRGGEGVLVVYRGVDNTNPIDAQGTTNTATSASATFNSVTTVTAGAMFIGAFAQSNAAGGLVSQTSGSPTLTVRGNNGNGGATTTKEAAGFVDGVITTAGASGAFVWSATNAVWSTDTCALRPASVGGPPPPTNQFFAMF